MITPEAARALDLINSIDTCKEVDAGFWLGVVSRTVVDLGEGGTSYCPHAQTAITVLLRKLWETLPDKPAKPEPTPRQQYEAALARHSEAAEDLGRKRQAYGKSIQEAAEEYEAARAALAEFEASPGVPRPEFTERPTVAEEERSLSEFEQRKLAETRKFENVFRSAGVEGVEVIAVEEAEYGRAVRFRRARSSKITLPSLMDIAPQIGVILRLHPDLIRFVPWPLLPGDIVMELHEKGVAGDGHGNDDS